MQLQHTTYYKPRHRERHGEAIAGATAAPNGRNVNASQSEKPVQEPGEELVSAGKPAQARQGKRPHRQKRRSQRAPQAQSKMTQSCACFMYSVVCV